MKTKHTFFNFIKNISKHFSLNIGTILVVTVLLFANNVRAAGMNAGTSPSTISYQGTLSTASGTQINAATGLTFRLYNTQSGGTALWTEAHTGANTVPVANGLFNILLGSITPIPSTVWNNATVYLGVQVEGDAAELSPREMVSSVPMAMMTSNITIPDNSVITSKIATGAVTSDKMALTSWSITDTTNQTWQTTLSEQYVEVPEINFTVTPPTDGVVSVDLSLTFSHTVSYTQLFCGIFVNTENTASARTTTLWNGGEESCSTNLLYPVQAGQTYRFYAAVYAMKPGTLAVHKGVFTQLSGMYFGRP